MDITISLETAVINTLRNGSHNVTIGQLTGLLNAEIKSGVRIMVGKVGKTAATELKSATVLAAVNKLVKDGYVKRAEHGGMSYFSWHTALDAQKPKYTVVGGRIIQRDGVTIIQINRVDDWQSGKPNHLSPSETDDLTARICELLNKEGK